jgi:hypothetical protein
MKKQITRVQSHMRVVMELSVMNAKARLLDVKVTRACETIGTDRASRTYEDSIVAETPNLTAPHRSIPRRSNSALITSKTNSAGVTARVVQRMIAARAAAFSTVKFTYTSSFQYSLTSYFRTSSTQVVSRPCRGISRL